MSRHRTRPSRRGIPGRRWVPIAIVAGVIVAGAGAVGIGAALSGGVGGADAAAEAPASPTPSATGCAMTPVTLRIAVASGFRPVIDALPKDPCVDLEVQDGDGFAGAVALHQQSADVWISDSRSRAYVLDQALAADAPSLASSPVVLSASPTTAAQFTPQTANWGALVPTDAAAAVQLETQDWDASSVMFATMSAVTDAGTAATGDKYLAYAGSAGAAQRLIAGGDVDPSVPAADGTIRVSEQRLVTAGDALLPTVTGVPALDYPWIEPAIADAAVADAAAGLLEQLQGDDGAAAIADAGFEKAGAATVQLGDTSAPVFAQPAIESTPLLFVLADPSVFSGRVLALFDVSGSMGDVPAGSTISGMDAVRQAVTLFVSTMPDDVVVGGEAFGFQLAPPSDVVTIMPSAPLSQNRASVLQAAAALAPQDTGTALYSSFLSGYRTAVAEAQPGDLTTVAVFTDGKNEDAPGALDLNGMLAQLQQSVDPSKTVVPLFFGMGDADIPAMQQITAVTGGNVWKIDRPEQVVGAIIEATAQTGRIGIPAELLSAR